MPNAGDNLFRFIKSIEDVFPIPTPVATITVGTLDVAAREFTGIKTDWIDNSPGSRPPRTKIPAVISVNAVEVSLTFNVENLQGGFAVGVDGILSNNFGGENENALTVDIGRRSRVFYTMFDSNTNLLMQDELFIRRPPIVGVGAFRIPVLPVAVVYEPPPSPRPQNTSMATYTNSTSFGTTIGTSFSREDSTAIPLPSAFDDLESFASSLKTLASIMGVFPNPDVQAAGKYVRQVGEKIDEGLGDITTELQWDTKISEDNRLEVEVTTGQITTTGTQGKNDGGPGVGDLIMYLVNVRLIWLANSGQVTLALIGYGRLDTFLVSTLKDDLAKIRDPFSGSSSTDLMVLSDEPRIHLDRTIPLGRQTQLDAYTLEKLLDLDPFVSGGPRGLDLPESRFAKIGVYGGDRSYKRFQQVTKTQERLRATTDFWVETVSYSKGFLSLIGLGSAQNKKVIAKSTLGSLRSQTWSDTQGATIEFGPAPPGFDNQLFEDLVFGTFLVMEVPRSPNPLMLGKILHPNNHPAVGEVVTLVQGQNKFFAQTDEHGQYAFHSYDIHPGHLTLTVGTESKDIQLRQGESHHENDLYLHHG